MFRSIYYIIAFSYLLFGASIASAEPITINGVNWGRDTSEMINELQSDGYSCKKEINPFWTKETKGIPQYIGDECKKGEASISFMRETIYFNCHVFNMCDFSLQSAAQKFVDSGKIETLTPKFIQGNSRVGTLTTTEMCGEGQDGDSVCLIAYGTNTNFQTLELKKSSFGKDVGFK